MRYEPGYKRRWRRGAEMKAVALLALLLGGPCMADPQVGIFKLDPMPVQNFQVYANGRAMLTVSEKGVITVGWTEAELRAVLAKPKDTYQGEHAYAALALEILTLRETVSSDCRTMRTLAEIVGWREKALGYKHDGPLLSAEITSRCKRYGVDITEGNK